MHYTKEQNIPPSSITQLRF